MAAASSTATQDILTTFGFTTPEKVTALSTLLRETGGFIAGGAALYWFLGESSPMDQDLDIWIPTRTRRNMEYDPLEKRGFRHLALTTLADGSPDPTCFAHDVAVVDRVSNFLTVMGYSPIERTAAARWAAERDGVSVGSDIPYHKNPEFQRIVKKIVDFRSAIKGGRKIQVIFYYGDTEPLTGFDLDVCQIAVRPTEEGGFVVNLPAGLDEAEVRAKRMRITNTSCTSNLVRRLEKYYARGFVAIDKDGHVLKVDSSDDAWWR